MKINVKTLKGTSFEIDVNLGDKVSDVKKNIESTQGQTYPAEQQMLIYQGKVLKDDTTLEDNKVAENTFIVVMLSKPKGSASGSSTAPKTPAPVPPTNTVQSAPTVPAPVPTQAPPSTLPPAPASAAAPTGTAAPATAVSVSEEGDVYGQAASNLVSGSNLEQTVQQILDMGGGTWDRDTVIRALRAAYNNPERAIDYLYSGIPEVEAPPMARIPPAGAGQVAAGANPAPAQPAPQQPAVPSSGPNANPLDLFPQGLPAALGGAAGGGGAGGLEMLRNSPQFRTLLALVQSNPQILQPMLQELGKQNPQILRIIQENQAEFLRLVNEHNAEGGADPNLLGQLAGAAAPQTIRVTPEEQEAIERLEAMGFNRELVLQVFFACNKNEELAANYLLDHVHEFEDQ
ncbi:hypothetical protein LUZ60_000199 [Juncus effusus]|nr:hypothetical protein LUZ60_000199 [Juncus effusus]